MISAVIPRLHTPKTAFGSKEDGKIEITTGHLQDAPKLLGALATGSAQKPLKQGNNNVPVILSGSFDLLKKTVNLQVLPANYDDMRKAIIDCSYKTEVNIVNIK